IMQPAAAISDLDEKSSSRELLHNITTLILTMMTLYIVFGSHNIAYSSDKKSVPNIVFILADDMGLGDVTALNRQSRIPTPHLDKLARQSLVFTDAHAAGSYCVPS